MSCRHYVPLDPKYFSVYVLWTRASSYTGELLSKAGNNIDKIYQLIHHFFKKVPTIPIKYFIAIGFPGPESNSRPCIAFTVTCSWVSLNLEQFPRLSLYFLILMILKRTGQLCCIISLPEGLLDVFSWLDSGYTFKTCLE